MSKSLLDLSHLCQPEDEPDHPWSSWPSIPPHPLGRLVLLTPEVTASAARSIITGKRFGLDWSISPSGGRLGSRMPAEHRVARVDSLPPTKEETLAVQKIWAPHFDCFLHFNTQSSTQWDYFMHYSYSNSGIFYGGLTPEKIIAQDTGDFGVAAISKAGGIQTRGILIDVPLYLRENNLPPLDPLSKPSSARMDLPFLKKAFAYFKIEPRVGDVLLVRTGFEDLIIADKVAVARGEPEILGSNKWAGVEANIEIVQWLFSTGVIAVGSDNPTFEEWPHPYPEMSLHPILLSGLGILIGEMLRLNELARECRTQGRWEFFFSSNPIHIEHGVASPPNASAIL